MWIKRKKLYLNYVRRNYYAINYEKLNPMYLWFIAITLILPLFVPLFLSQQAQAATVTWDGGGADTNWSTCANWSGDTCPTSADDVVFSGSGTSTLSAGTTIRSLDMSGYTGTLTHNASVNLSIGDATAGAGNVALLLASGMTYTLGSATTSIILFVSTSTTQQTVNFAGKAPGALTFNGSGGNWQLTGTIAASGGGLSLTGGTLDTNGQAVTRTTFTTGSGSTTKVLTLGATTYTTTGAGNAWDTINATNFTLNANTSTVIISGAGSGMRVGNVNLTFNNVEFTGSGTQSVLATSGSGNFTAANLTRTGTAADTDGFQIGLGTGTVTVTGTFTITGQSAVVRVLMSSATVGTQRTITAAAVSLTNVDFQDINAAGVAAPWTGTSLGDANGNANITFTTAVTRYAVAAGNWSSTAVWSATDGGAAGASVPLCHDTVILNGNAGAGTYTIDLPRIGKDINFTGFTRTLSLSQAHTMYGNLVYGSGMTISGVASLTFAGRSSHTITSAGKTTTAPIVINTFGGTYTLADAFTTSSTISLNAGTFDTASFAVSSTTFTANTALAQTLTLGTTNWSLTSTATATVWVIGSTNLTLNASTATITVSTTSANTRTFAGGGKTYGTLTYTVAGSTGGLDITGSNTFATINFSDVTNARTLRFTAGTTTTITTSFNVNGTATKLMTIGSITAASHTLTYSGAGDVSSDYLSISRSTATPADTWYAGANSTDGGNNSGWIFTVPPSGTAPNAPTSLIQRKVDDTSIAEGGWTNETTVEFVGTATDTDNPDTLQICVEKDLLGTSFSNTEDACGTGVAYSGSGVSVMVSIGSQTDASEYHWQARVKDAGGLYSSWVSYPTPTPNAESARDYGIDTTAPTGGTVYDGTNTGVDEDFNNGSLSALSANWASFNSNVSGLNKYQYAIGTTSCGTDIVSWTDNADTDVTATGLTLDTSKFYYFGVRAVDNASNTQSCIASDGQMVLPDLSFTVSSTSMTFADLTSSSSPAFTDGNDTSDGRKTTLTTSTNAFNGYVIRAFATSLLTSGANTIADYNGGTYASPDAWQSGDTGFGFTSTDTSVQGTNIFQAATCPGGSALSGPGCFAPFTLSGPGDIVADHTASVSGTPISNEAFDIYYQVRVTYSQHAKTYSTSVIYTNTPTY